MSCSNLVYNFIWPIPCSGPIASQFYNTSSIVGTIIDAKELSQWNYIDSKSNPADDMTRGQTANKFINNRRWLQGPEILWEEKQKWSVDYKATALSPDDP